MSRSDGIPLDSTKCNKAIKRLPLGCRKPLAQGIGLIDEFVQAVVSGKGLLLECDVFVFQRM